MQDMAVGKRPKRYFTPEQKFQIIQDIGTCPVIKDGLARHAITYTTYAKWKRQLDVGIKASLRNTKPIALLKSMIHSLW